jgi:hypothetical protein
MRGYMLKAILMSITLIVMLAGPADATVIYNWRTLSVERGAEMSGFIGFSDKAWLARRAEVEFTGFGQPPADPPGEPPRFFYPNQDGDGDVDLDPDVLELSFSIVDIGGGTISLVTGENRSLFLHLSTGITFDDIDRPSGFIGVSGEFSGFNLNGDATLWTARYGSDGACFFTCVSTGTWELDPSTIPVDEPGSLLLILTGLILTGLMGMFEVRGVLRMPDRFRLGQHFNGC